MKEPIENTGISERVRKDFNIRAVFKSAPTPCSRLNKVKDLSLWEPNVVYELLRTYREVNNVDTRCQLEINMKEQNDRYMHQRLHDKSAIAKHTWTEDHPIHWEDDTRILQSTRQTMKETICKWTASL